jgi:hypothetical protein
LIGLSLKFGNPGTMTPIKLGLMGARKGIV